ncbi:MAG: GTP-binding protein [Candidatus Heimdallarchaeota archaeon]
MTYDAIFKVVVFGDAGCGKTTLTKRYVTDLFIPDSHMTIGVDFELKDVRINGSYVKLCLWDFGGEERFRFIFPKYISGAMGGILMYDLTNQSSISHIHDWLSVIHETQLDFPIVLVGGKKDLDTFREVSYKEGLKLAKSLGLDYFIECSSKTGENVEKIFEKLTELMVNIAIIY